MEAPGPPQHNVNVSKMGGNSLNSSATNLNNNSSSLNLNNAVGPRTGNTHQMQATAHHLGSIMGTANHQSTSSVVGSNAGAMGLMSQHASPATTTGLASPQHQHQQSLHHGSHHHHHEGSAAAAAAAAASGKLMGQMTPLSAVAAYSHLHSVMGSMPLYDMADYQHL